ncbi:MAG: CPBP family intramembrane glutamic endopeptidase [Gemmataceae bacterium]
MTASGTGFPSEVKAPRSSRTPYFGIAFEGGLILLAWVAGWLVGLSPLDTLHFTVSGFILVLLATLPMLAAFFLLLRSRFEFIKRILRIFDDIAIPFLGSFTWFDLALLSLLAGIGEEMLFRGVIQASLDAWLGPWLALALASLVFGLLHALTPAYAVLATLAGAYLGFIWLAAGNLLVVIEAHALYDFIALTILLRKIGSKAVTPSC